MYCRPPDSLNVGDSAAFFCYPSFYVLCHLPVCLKGLSCLALPRRSFLNGHRSNTEWTQGLRPDSGESVANYFFTSSFRFLSFISCTKTLKNPKPKAPFPSVALKGFERMCARSQPWKLWADSFLYRLIGFIHTDKFPGSSVKRYGIRKGKPNYAGLRKINGVLDKPAIHTDICSSSSSSLFFTALTSPWNDLWEFVEKVEVQVWKLWTV